jgi:hypothetical protein
VWYTLKDFLPAWFGPFIVHDTKSESKVRDMKGTIEHGIIKASK